MRPNENGFNVMLDFTELPEAGETLLRLYEHLIDCHENKKDEDDAETDTKKFSTQHSF